MAASLYCGFFGGYKKLLFPGFQLQIVLYTFSFQDGLQLFLECGHADLRVDQLRVDESEILVLPEERALPLSRDFLVPSHFFAIGHGDDEATLERFRDNGDSI